ARRRRRRPYAPQIPSAAPRPIVDWSEEGSSVDFPQHNVDRPDDGDHVGNQPAFAHLLQSLERGERWVAHVDAIRLGGAVADNVVAHLAARRLHCLVDLSGGNGEAFGDDLEVVDERLHLRLHVLAIGQNDFRSVGLDGAFRHAVERLLANLNRLTHLFKPDQVARQHVAVVGDGDLELELLIAGVRHVTAQIPVHAGGAQRRAGDSEGDGVFRAQRTHALEAAHPDGVAGKQALVLVNSTRKGLQQLLNAAEEVERRLQRETAHAEVRGHHALSADGLEDAKNFLALAEAIEEDGERADVHGVRAEPDQVGIEPRELIQQHANPLRALRNFNLQKLFDGQAVAQVVGHRAQVIDAVRQRHHLLIELRFAGLLDSCVQITDVRHNVEHRFAVDFDDKAENAMRRRVLRSHVQDHSLVFRAFLGTGLKQRGGRYKLRHVVHYRYPSTG